MEDDLNYDEFGPRVSLEEADFEPLHPGEVLGMVLDAQSETIESFARACDFDPGYLEKVVQGEANFDDVLLDRSMRVLGNAWENVRSAKFTYDYYQLNHKLPPFNLVRPGLS